MLVHLVELFNECLLRFQIFLDISNMFDSILKLFDKISSFELWDFSINLFGKHYWFSEYLITCAISFRIEYIYFLILFFRIRLSNARYGAG